jgi:amino acid permease
MKEAVKGRSNMDLQEAQSFIRKTLGDTVGFIVLVLVFCFYFPVLMAYIIANAISMGIFSMLTNDRPSETRGGLWWIFPAIPTVVLLGGAIAWTIVLGSIFLKALSK